MDWNCSCKSSIEFRVVVYEVGRGTVEAACLLSSSSYLIGHPALLRDPCRTHYLG